MGYKLYDKSGNEITLGNLQDKGPWCEHGATKEQVFIRRYGAQLSLGINPAKQRDPYSPDLFNVNTGRVGDLKTQNTPFFKSKRLYGYEPQYTVTFNKKDAERYSELYPDIEIYFWVDWNALKFVQDDANVEVKPMTGVWFANFKDLKELSASSPLHDYQQRVDDKRGNAKSSYLFQVDNPAFTRII